MSFIVVDFVHCPKWTLVFCKETAIAGVLISCFVEWYILGSHQEQYYTAGKEIRFMCLIFVFVPEFWGHVLWRAELRRREALISCSPKRTGETEIRDFDVVVLIKKTILRFHVSVCHVIFMHVVDCLYNLLEEEFAC